MKKYILILFSIFTFGQSGLIARQNFGHKANLGTNTEIGGVASTISTPALLATKLGISIGNISNFSVVGSDIKCKIIGSYAIPANAFTSNSSIKYYRDFDNLVTSLGASSFESSGLSEQLELKGVASIGLAACDNLHFITDILFRNASSIADSGFSNFYGKAESVYIPMVTSLGSSSLNNNVFVNVKSGIKIYCNPSLATNNSGGEDGDIAYARAAGCIIRFVSNFTAPNSISDLTISSVCATSATINFTAPTGSTNAIEYYECYADGIFKNRINGSGQLVMGLTPNTTHIIEVKPVDIFLNKSTSNTVSQLTLNNSLPIGAETETITYVSRANSDSGIVTDIPRIDVIFKNIKANSLDSNLLFWHNNLSGVKKDGSNLVEKMYSFIGSNTDVAQTTTANKPTYTTTGVTFDTTDGLTKTLSPTINNKTFSIMWTVKAFTGNYYPLVNLGGWDAFQMHSASDGSIYGGITVANRFALGSGSFLTNTDATYTFTYNSTTKIGKMYRGTTLLGSKTMVDPINFTTLYFDAQGGTFYDLKMFSKDLTLTEITNLQ